jgi:hypothetical protein
MLDAEPLTAFHRSYVERADVSSVATGLEAERKRLADPAHLEENVLGTTEFEWDFEPIFPGFLDVVAPFIAEPCGAGALFLALLRELGGDRAGPRRAIALLEYAHQATRISDHFSYHDEFAELRPDQAIAERLVQLRYGAQWLNNYPRYLITTNALDVAPAARIAVHRWGHQSFTATGMSRALFLRLAQRGLHGLQRSAWLASAPHALCELVVSPAVMAAILAGRDDADVIALKEAFSHLAVAVKADLEAGALAGSPQAFLAMPAVEVSLRFPGFALAVAPDVLSRVDVGAVSGSRFTKVRSIAAAATAALVGNDARRESSIAALRALAAEHRASFRAALAVSKLLPIARSALAEEASS